MTDETMNSAYSLAQQSLANLKVAVRMVLADAPTEGLRNVDIGRRLGIYGGHEGHEGHISRTILGLMEVDGTVQQNGDNQHWILKAQ